MCFIGYSNESCENFFTESTKLSSPSSFVNVIVFSFYSDLINQNFKNIGEGLNIFIKKLYYNISIYEYFCFTSFICMVLLFLLGVIYILFNSLIKFLGVNSKKKVIKQEKKLEFLLKCFGENLKTNTKKK